MSISLGRTLASPLYNSFVCWTNWVKLTLFGLTDQLDALAGTALAEHALGSDGVAASATAHALGDGEGGAVLPYDARFGEGWGQNGTVVGQWSYD